ncbi:MAG TPA: MCE family protein [Acidimicrobiales bacterium]|nr:MCE family protein [Acidimicrobiales bacterium]
MSRRRLWIAVGVAAAVVAALVGVVVFGGGGSTRTIYAEFTEAPGLYSGNHVDVLGIPVGTITRIKPEGRYVMVTMQVSSGVKLPAGADAVIMAPEVVADRFIQLGPAYTSGPTLAPGSVIPLQRTAIPQSVDAVIATLDNLAQQLGPNGANKHGALTDLVHQLATQLGHSGPDLHSSIVNFSQALNGLAADSPGFAGTINNLGSLSQALADNSGAYRSFASDLAQVSQILANDRQDISAVLASLQHLFANLTDFIQHDGSALGSSMRNLDTFVAALNSQQKALAQAYSITPLALQNLTNAVDKSAPGGAAIRGRYDPVAATQTLFNQVCGSAGLRFLVILATGTQTNPLTTANTTDTLCGIGNALNALTPPPGAAPGPDLSLKALTG